MRRKYFLIAETAYLKNNRLTAVNIWNDFSAVFLPAKFDFDLAFICDPGWSKGEYDLIFKIKIKNNIKTPGNVKINVPNPDYVFNAVAQNLTFYIDKGVEKVTFYVECNNKHIFSRDYPVVTTFNVTEEKSEQDKPDEAED